MVPLVSALDLPIAVPSTALNSKGAIASPSLKPLLNLHSEDKCLPVLTLAYIPLFKILHSVANLFVNSSLCISLHIAFSIQCHLLFEKQ